MTPSLNTITFTKPLVRWYKKHRRDLPWRQSKDPYAIWVSEMMLQQTTVATVKEYYHRWLKEFPTVHDLANASLQKVLKMWQGLGYYNRARNLHKSAQIVVKDYHGHLPKDPLVVQKLPGFGPYSVASVLSIAYDCPLPVVDANVRRLMLRLFAITDKPQALHDKNFRQILSKLIPSVKTGEFNQALMELGSLLCRPKDPICKQCPLQKHCLAYKKNLVNQIPEKVKKQIHYVQASIGIIKRGETYFIQQRVSDRLLSGLWEFPGGKIEKGETPLDALKRELKEEINVKVVSAKPLCEVVHFYTKYKVKLFVFLCEVKVYPQANEYQQWVSLDQMQQYPMPSGSAKILPYLSMKS